MQPSDEGEYRARPAWRHEMVERASPGPFESEEGVLRLSWVRLQTTHTAFRASEQREYQSLVRTVREIELLFLQHPQLRWYYEECMRPEAYSPMSTPAGVGQAGGEVDHIATIQANLMEDVYETLQLRRYANAPDNRGWMNLLRRWGRSPTFNQRFDALQMTFSLEFVEFYDIYLRDYPLTIEESPVPHSWDPPSVRADPRDAGFFLPGIFLDSGIREAGTERRTPRNGQRPVPQPGTGGHGIADAKGGDQGYEQAPSAPPVSGAEGTSK